MLEVVLALICIGIAIKAIQQVRRDPRFTRPVVIRHLAALLIYFTFAGLMGYVVVKAASWSTLSDLSPDARAAWLTIGFLLVLSISLFLLLRYLNRVFRRESGAGSKGK